MISNSACWFWKRGDVLEDIKINQYEIISFQNLQYFIYKTRHYFLIIAQMKHKCQVWYIQNRFAVNYIQCLKKIIIEDELCDESYDYEKKYDLILPISDRIKDSNYL
jgi:hypothetical protein